MKKFTAIINLTGVALIVIPTLTAQVSNIEKVDPCITCEQLMDQQLPDVTITSAERVAEGNPHCRILGVIGREIKFELLLPDKWNARYIMGGGMGFGGAISNWARNSVNNGYATSGTDTGHEGNMDTGWALNNMERQVNYAHLAVHRTALVSKAIITEYYGQFPLYNYFIGCSTGGNQAMIEAQLYPEDFDGIVAGDPSINIPGLCAKFIHDSQILFPDPDDLDVVTISKAQFEFLQEAILVQCDEIDGINDNIINDPRNCKFKYSCLPLCSDIIERKTCFTLKQIDNIKMLFAGLTIQDKKVYPEYSPGSAEYFGLYELPHYIATGFFKYIVFNDPEWDYSTYNFSNYFNDIEFANSNFSASLTDYSTFNSHGGKLIIYNGWNDVSVNNSIEHFEAVKWVDSSVDNYLKLYLLPGVGHCGGGLGPSDVDWIEIIRNWVENGKSPDRIILSKTENNEVVMTRPVYPYPRIAVYDGSGDTNIESNWIEK